MKLKVFAKLVITLSQYFGVFQCQAISKVFIELIEAYSSGTKPLDPIIKRLNNIFIGKDLCVGYLAHRYNGEPKTITLTNHRWGTTLLFELDDTSSHLCDVDSLNCGLLKREIPEPCNG